jgi:PilZ domain-containing protein
MDLRSQLRLEADEPVHVTVLGECETTLLGRITNYSANGMALEIDAQVSIGTAVKVEWSNTLLLGEVCYCTPAGEGFSIGLRLEHALYNTSELARLAKRLLDESPQEEMPQVKVPKRL